MNNYEKMIIEGLQNLLGDKAKLGLADHDVEESSHFQQFGHEDIEDSFRLKSIDSPFSDVLNSTFNRVHSYKYIDHPYFDVAFKKNLSMQGIPEETVNEALEWIEEIREDYAKNHFKSEADMGWNPKLDEIRDVTTNADNREPKQESPFTGGGPAPADSIA